MLAVAGRALRTAEHPDSPGEVAFARVLSRSGRWITLHGASLVTGSQRRVAVIVEPAHPARINPLLMAAYGLTDRKQEITRLVLQGDSTAQIAGRLVLSPHTVQEHLKHIFEKTGIRSRRDLTGSAVISRHPNADTVALVARRLAGAQNAQFDRWWTAGRPSESNVGGSGSWSFNQRQPPELSAAGISTRQRRLGLCLPELAGAEWPPMRVLGPARVNDAR